MAKKKTPKRKSIAADETVFDLTEQQLAELIYFDAQRLTKQREADALDKKVKALKAHVNTFMTQQGVEILTIGRHHVEYVEGRPTVRWKDVVVELKGPLYAADLLEQAPKPQRVKVTQLGA